MRPEKAFIPGHVPGENITHNVRVKTYPDGTASVLVADRAIFRAPGWERSERQEREARFRAWEERFLAEAYDAQGPAVLHDGERSVWELEGLAAREAQREADSLARAQRRARASVRDLALSNDFRYFVTLTLDGAKVDRYDVAAVTRKLNAWLDNHVRRDGLAYVLVPELHKDGALHFHGLFNGALGAVDSGTIDLGHGKPRKPRSAAQRAAWLAQGGHVVYNLPAWSLGFTTAIELYGERSKAVGYVCKYIGKQQRPGPDGTPRPGKIGGRWYYSGGALRRPVVTYADASPEAFEGVTGYTFTIPALGARVKIIDMEKGEAKHETSKAAGDVRGGAEGPGGPAVPQNVLPDGPHGLHAVSDGGAHSGAGGPDLAGGRPGHGCGPAPGPGHDGGGAARPGAAP